MTGWTWDYVEDNITMPRLRALHEEWRRCPPLPIMVAAWLGIMPREESTGEELVERIRGMEKQ